MEDARTAPPGAVRALTVSVHVANIKAKLGASSRLEIAFHAIELGLVESPAQTRA